MAHGSYAHTLKPVNSVEGIDEYRLANGLQVLLVPDQSKPTTTVNVTYRVGSRHENYGETGMAHLLEHLIFKGSPKHSDPWSEFTKRGLAANGTTWFDRTNYFASFAANDENLKWYLEWQADAMVNSFIAKKHLDTEMTVVRNEMERGENSPGRVTYQRVLAAMYQWHNYGKDTIGARADVENVNIDRLKAFYKFWYQPDNATLIVSGKFDANKVLDWIDVSFGKLPKPARIVPPAYTLDPAQDGERSVTVRRKGGSPLSLAAYHVPPGAHPDFAAIEVLDSILADAPTGRLHKRLVEETKLASAVGSAGMALAEPGFAFVQAVLAPNASQERMNSEMLAVVEGFAQRPVTSEELKRAQTRWLNQWEKLFTSPEQVGITLSSAIAQGDWRLFFLMRDRIKALTPETVQRVAVEYFVASNRTLGQYLPTETPVRAPVPAFVDVAAQIKTFVPQAAVAQAAAFEATPENLDRQAIRRQLPTGLKLTLLAKSTRGEAVRGSLNLQLGDAASLLGKESVAGMAAAMLRMGTATKTREQLKDALDAAKVEVQISAAAADRVSVSWSTKREFAAPAIALIAEMLRSPRFEPAALEELRAQSLTGLQFQKGNPESLAPRAVNIALNNVPRGHVHHARSFEEEDADVKAVTLDEVKAFHAAFYGANQAQMSLVGDFDPQAVSSAVLAGFGDWKARAGYVRIPQVANEKAGAIQLLRTPDKQNAMLMGELPMTLKDDHPDYPALVLANHMLGGGGSSRLWVRIREREGLSYGTGTGVSLSAEDPYGSWYVYAIFAPQNREKVEAALRDEVAKVLKEGFTAKELEEAKTALLNQRRLSLAQDATVAGMLSRQARLGRTFERERQLDAAIQKADLQQVNEALRRHFRLEGFQLVFAGDFK